MNVVCINRNNKDRYRFTCTLFFFSLLVVETQTDVLHWFFFCSNVHKSSPARHPSYTNDPLQKPIPSVKEDFQVFKNHFAKMESASAQDCIKIASILINWRKYSTPKESTKMIRLCQWLVKIQSEKKFFAKQNQINFVNEYNRMFFNFVLFFLSMSSLVRQRQQDMDGF